MKRLLVLSAIILVAGCGNGTSEDVANSNDAALAEAQKTAAEAEAAAAAAMKTAGMETNPVPVVEAVALSDTDKGRVCRAAIASLMGREPGIIRVISTSGGVHRVRYTRDDGTVWTNECSVGDGTAQWRTVENGQPGRWRNEDTIRFTVDGPTINIDTFMGGEPMTSDSYTVE